MKVFQMNFTIKFTKIDSGFMGQIMELPEVVSEGFSMDDCRLSVQDALNEMIKAYKQIGLEPPKNLLR